MLFFVEDYTWIDKGGDDLDKKITSLPNCKLVNGLNIDTRYVSHPSLMNCKETGATWYNNGINHRVENNTIKRDFDAKFYIIEINTLEELVEMQKQLNCNIGIGHDSEYIYEGKVLAQLHYDYYME